MFDLLTLLAALLGGLAGWWLVAASQWIRHLLTRGRHR